MMEFQLIYEVINEPTKVEWSWIGFSIVLGLISYFIRGTSKGPLTLITATVSVILGICGILLSISNVIKFSGIQSRYEKNDFKVVEGLVKDFDPMPYEGHKRESFTVSNTKFAFTDYNKIEYGFNRTASHGGAIKDGSYVRLGFITEAGENIIWKVEIKK